MARIVAHMSDVDAELVDGDVYHLRREKRLFGRRVDGVFVVTVDAALLPAIDSSLPMLHAGKGARRDGCRHEGECLGRFLATARRPSASAHCPTGCTQYAPIERHERVGASMLGGISSLGMAQELIAETGDDE